MDKRNIIIIGSGPAGLTAAIYAARASLAPLLFAGVEFGGQLMTTTEIENFPGFPEGIQGPDLMMNMVKQAERFGTEIRFENVTAVDFGEMQNFKVYVGDTEYTAKSVIVATGARPRLLDLPSEHRLWGKGVTSCATCDGPFYRGKVVAVIGGGDSAMEEATFLTRFASKVYLIHRRDEFRASKIMVQKVKANAKIEIILHAEVLEILGEPKVSGVKLLNKQIQTESTLNLDGVFMAIGHIPVTNYLVNKAGQPQLEILPSGYIHTRDQIYASVEGVFVAGDVQDSHFRQAITAAGTGAMTALEAEKWLVENS